MEIDDSNKSLISKLKTAWFPIRFAVPILTVILILLGLSIFYYIDFNKRENYFIKRGFRQLSLISDTIALQTDNYYKAIINAPPDIDEQYITTFLPGVQFSYENSKNYPENTIISEDDNYYLYLKLNSKNKKAIFLKAPILTLLKNQRSELISSKIFDDILLADQDGKVIFQLNKGGTKIIQFNSLIPTHDGEFVKPEGEQPKVTTKNNPRFASVSTFSNIIDVQIAGSKQKLFIHPLYLNIGNTEVNTNRPHYVLCGIIQSDKFFFDSLHIPFIVLIWIMFCAILLGLSLPILKTILIKSKERFSHADGLRIFFVMPIFTFMLTLSLVSAYHFYFEDKTDEKLKAFAESLMGKFSNELLSKRLQLENLGLSDNLKNYPQNISSFERVPDVLKTIVTSYDTEKNYPFFNSVFWMDSSGQHKVLWHVREKAPPLINVGNRAYAKDLFEKRYSYVKTGLEQKSPITMEPINSWITGENSLVLCIPHNIGGAGIVTKPLSLIGSYVPSTFGFALIKDDGSVLFHKEQTRNLVENIFVETDLNQSLIEAVKTRNTRNLNVTYKGSDYRFYVTKLNQLDNLPWTLVVFRERTPLRLYYTQILIECITFSFVLYAIICGIVYLFIRSSKSTLATNYQSRYFPLWLLPDSKSHHKYLFLTIVFAALILISLIILYLKSTILLLVSVFVFPVAAVLLYVIILLRNWSFDFLDKVNILNWKVLYLFSLIMLFFQISIFPCLAIFEIFVNFENQILKKQQQIEVADFYQQRENKILDYYRKINFSSDEKRNEFLNARLRFGSQAFDSYEGIVDNIQVGTLQETPQCEMSKENRPKSLFRFLNFFRPPLDSFGLKKEHSESDSFIGSDWFWCEDNNGASLIFDNYRTNQKIQILAAPHLVKANNWAILLVGITVILILIYYLTRFITQKIFFGCFDFAQSKCDYGFQRIDSFSKNTIVICNDDVRKQLLKRFNSEENLVIDISKECGSKNFKTKTLLQNISQCSSVVINNFEFKLDEDDYNFRKIEILKESIKYRKTILIFSTVEPLSYINDSYSDFSDDERENKTQMLEEYSEILCDFSKSYFYNDNSVSFKLPARNEDENVAILYEECKFSNRLREIGEEIKQQYELVSLSAEELIEEIGSRAEAYYRVLWKNFSVKEKLFLIHLAQEGFVNPQAQSMARIFMRKGIIVCDPALRVFNESFRRFVSNIVPDEQVKFWEQDKVSGGWNTVRIIFWMGFISLTLFLVYTQRDVLQSWIAILTATIGTIAALFKLLDDFMKNNVKGNSENK